MTKLIRVDKNHYFYLLDRSVSSSEAERYMTMFGKAWPGKTLIVMWADEFMDLTGDSQVVPEGALIS